MINKIYNKFQNINTKLLSVQFLQFNVSRHKLVPKHEKVDKRIVLKIMKKYGLKHKNQLPYIFISDPQCKYNGFRVGDVIKITRVSKTNTKSIVYRLVVENDSDVEIQGSNDRQSRYKILKQRRKNEAKKMMKYFKSIFPSFNQEQIES